MLGDDDDDVRSWLIRIQNLMGGIELYVTAILVFKIPVISLHNYLPYDTTSSTEQLCFAYQCRCSPSLSPAILSNVTVALRFGGCFKDSNVQRSSKIRISRHLTCKFSRLSAACCS